MLKHDIFCLETASEEDGTPAVLRECDENNSNQVHKIIQWKICIRHNYMDIDLWTCHNFLSSE